MVPVGRTNVVPDGPGSRVTPGSDAVMCLSCHRAHAREYPEMLRWDYSAMVVGSGSRGGYFVCHSAKN
jgi:predicted CXXCH cytochrome family protein